MPENCFYDSGLVTDWFNRKSMDFGVGMIGCEF